MVLVGLALLFPALAHRLEAALAPLQRLADVLQTDCRIPACVGQAAAGALLALVWAPCAGPTLAAAFVLAAKGGSLAFAMVSMGVFALGAAGALLALGYGLGRPDRVWPARGAGDGRRGAVAAGRRLRRCRRADPDRGRSLAGNDFRRSYARLAQPRQQQLVRRYPFSRQISKFNAAAKPTQKTRGSRQRPASRSSRRNANQAAATRRSCGPMSIRPSRGLRPAKKA